MRAPPQILLIGGGHAHVEVVRRLLALPWAGQVSLLSPHRFTYYSGMLPGLVAGHYAREQCRIDLTQLCGDAVRFLQASAVEIDTARGLVHTDDARQLPFDLLSLDIGSTTALHGIAGAEAVGVRVKPVEPMLLAVDHLFSARRPQRLVLVGGGAAGIELCLAFSWRAATHGVKLELHLVNAGSQLATNLAPRARDLLEAELARAGVCLHLNKQVMSAIPGEIALRGDPPLPFDNLLWATGASAPAWLRDTGLALDTDGFIQVDQTLRSTSHANIFAAGDIAALQPKSLPKSGVYAVRQGPVLAENLVNAARGETLRHYKPRHNTLALISVGRRHAIAAWGPFAWSGDWVWRWKDGIDRRFMRRYQASLSTHP